jgi:hypothetical protein
MEKPGKIGLHLGKIGIGHVGDHLEKRPLIKNLIKDRQLQMLYGDFEDNLLCLLLINRIEL